MKDKLEELKSEDKSVGTAQDNTGTQRGLCHASHFQGLPVGESTLNTDIPSFMGSGLDQRESPSAGRMSGALKTEGRRVVAVWF